MKYLIPFLFSFLFGSHVQAQTNKEKAMNNIHQAIVLEDQGKLDEALKLLEEAVQLDPETIQVSYELALGYYSKGAYQKCIDILEKLRTRKDVFSSVFHLLGNAYDKLSNLEKSIDAYIKGIEQFPNAGELYAEMGTMYLARKEYYSAMGWYENGIKMSPAFPSNYYWAAKIFCNSSDAVWGMLYGEIFLIMERDTKRTNEISKLLFDTYRNKITTSQEGNFKVNFSSPLQNDSLTSKKVPFAKAVYEPILMLAVLKEKKLDLNAICRLRKYFIDSYFKNGYYQTYPNVLFDFQYRVSKAGYMDEYNHYVLYNGDEKETEKWIGANKKKWDAFMIWFRKNQLQLDSTYRFYRQQYY